MDHLTTIEGRCARAIVGNLPDPVGGSPIFENRYLMIPGAFDAPYRPYQTPRRLLCGVERLQRLDRVSTLAAATAHTLNDELTVILSSLTTSMLAMEPGHPARLPLVDLERAALRCVSTASRLLSFSTRRGGRPVLASLEAVLED
jgi:signal transduction histidine kinase